MASPEIPSGGTKDPWLIYVILSTCFPFLLTVSSFIPGHLGEISIRSAFLSIGIVVVAVVMAIMARRGKVDVPLWAIMLIVPCMVAIVLFGRMFL